MSGTGNQEFQSLKTLKTLKMILGTYWTTFHVYDKKSLFIGEYDNAFCHCGLPFLELTGCGNDDQLVNKKSAVWAIVPFMSSMLRENVWESEKVRVVESDSGRECILWSQSWLKPASALERNRAHQTSPSVGPGPAPVNCSFKTIPIIYLQIPMCRFQNIASLETKSMSAQTKMCTYLIMGPPNRYLHMTLNVSHLTGHCLG